MTVLAVIDYGAGNLRSVQHALRHLNAPGVTVVQTPAELVDAHKIILPGVGAFGAGMNALHDQGLVAPLQDAVAAGVPLLGVCVGMQMLFDDSDEMGHHAGLGLLPGHVTRFPTRPGLKVPHMGWNVVTPAHPSALTNGLPDDSYGYFVHSYYCAPDDPADVVLSTHYGAPFAAAVARGHVYGVQFHPEKSQRTGLHILQNFLELPPR